MKDPNVRTILFKGQKIRQVKGSDDIWRDDNGTEYGYTDPAYYTDAKTRAGVGVLSLPESDPLSKAAATHDYAYSSPVYQKHHERVEADRMLEESVSKLSGWRKYLAPVFYGLVRAFGAKYWETKNTNK